MSDEQRRTEPSFSLYEFRKWLADQSQPQFKKLEKKETTNYQADSRIGIVRLREKITEHNAGIENVEELAETFKEQGGRVISSDGIHVTIQVDGKEFKLPKIYTKER